MTGLRAFELPTLEPVARPHPVAGQGPDPLADAHAEAELVREQARREGFAAGLEEGRAELRPAADALGAALAGVADLRAGLADALEVAAVDLALRVAEQALHATVAVESERVLEAVRGALRRLSERERVTILVHPDDIDVVRDAVADLVARLGGIDHCDVQAERRVTRGGAVVRTAEGEVDATVETKLQRAREVIERELAGD